VGATSGTRTTNPPGAPGASRVSVARSLDFCVMFCRSLFVPLSLFFWSLHCLYLLDVRLLISPGLSPNVLTPIETPCLILRNKLN
jgi:hypothetical protein